MRMHKDVIALVGAGRGGHALLSMLASMPGIEVRHVYDINPDAPGMILAGKLGIACSADPSFPELAGNSHVNLILEVTGLPEVFRKLGEIKSPKTSLIGAAGNRIIFSLLDTQDQATRRLEALKKSLEERVAARTAELERANQKLQEQIRAYQALNEKLQQINDQKTRYLLRSTHQLKAPFAAIQHYVDLVLDGYTGEITDKTRHIASKIKARCAMLSGAIKDMLQLANLRSCITENLVFRNVDLNHVLAAIVESLGVLARKADVRIRFQPMQGGCLVRCNRSQAEIMFSALVENAVTYSRPGSAIDIVAEDREGRREISVRDQGIGIEKENLSRIFEDFFRSNRAVEHHNDGTGMGLSMVREIASIHRFDVRVESEVDKGSTFTVSMPIPDRGGEVSASSAAR
jgi:signal transduction histidine kinase